MPKTDEPETVKTPEEIVPPVDDTTKMNADLSDSPGPEGTSTPEGPEVVTAEPDASDRSPGQEAPEIVAPAPPTVPDVDVPSP